MRYILLLFLIITQMVFVFGYPAISDPGDPGQ